nr:protein TPR1-like isoform X14 [Ipomoea batatas]
MRSNGHCQFYPQHWNTNSGSSMTVNVEAIPCMALSKDDSYVVSTSGEHVSLFSIMEFKVMKTFTWLQSPTTFLAFHPHDNYTIAIGTENSTIYIWDVRTDEAKSLEGHLKCITGLAFSTNCNILVSSGADARLCAWSIDTWQETISVPIRLHGDEVDADDKQPTQVMFHADQVHLLVTHETQLAIYDASNKMECIRRWIPHGSLSAPISSATYSCNSQLVYASFKDGNIGVLDADTLRPRCHIAPSAYLSQVISNRSEAAFPVVIAAHPEEPIQFAVGLTDGSVKVIQLLKSQVEWEVPSPQNNEILNGPDRIKSRELTEIVDPHKCRMVSMPESSDGKVVRLLYTNSGVGILALSSNDDIPKLWKWSLNDVQNTSVKVVNRLEFFVLLIVCFDLKTIVPCIGLFKDDSCVVSAIGGMVSLFNINTFNTLKIKFELIKGHHKHITGLAFSTTITADNKYMLVSSSADAQLCVWDIDSRWQKRRSIRIQLPAGYGEVHSGDIHVMFHIDQVQLLLTHETQLTIYDTSTMDRKRQWIPHGCLSARISYATYSCNSKLVYASFIDGNIGVLDANNLTLRCRIAPSAYLSPLISNRSLGMGVYAAVIAAHPQEPNQLALGLTDGSVKVIAPLESEGEWGISLSTGIKIVNGPNRTKLWELPKIVDQGQCQMITMPECSDVKVVRLLYTNSGVGILALSSNGIRKLWKWPNNEQNPTGKVTANSIPQHWQPNTGHDVSGVNLKEVVSCIALSYDDSRIVSAAGRKVSFFNNMTFKVLTTFRASSTPTFLAFYPDTNEIIAIGTEHGRIYIYNVRGDNKIKTKLNKGHHKYITGLAFSTTDRNMLVSSSADAQLCVWDIVDTSWKNRRSVRIQSPDGEVCSGDTHVMFYIDQVHLLVTHETQLTIYDTSNMERKRQWIPHGCLSARISYATYSCNSKLVYASFIDGNIGVLDANNLTLRCRITPSAYLSPLISNRSLGMGVYAAVIAAHPQEPNELALGLTDGSVKVIAPLESEGEWGISLSTGIKIVNGTAMAKHRADSGIRFTRSGVKSTYGSSLACLIQNLENMHISDPTTSDSAHRKKRRSDTATRYQSSPEKGKVAELLPCRFILLAGSFVENREGKKGSCSSP